MNDADSNIREMQDEAIKAAILQSQDKLNALMADVDSTLRAADILATGLHDALYTALRDALPRVSVDWDGWPGMNVVCFRVAESLYDMGYRKG